MHRVQFHYRICDHFAELYVTQLRAAVSSEIKGTSGEVDILTWMGRAALELIGQGGLGYSFDPLVADMEDTYGHALKTLQYANLFISLSASIPILHFRHRPVLSKNRIWLMLAPYYPLLGPAWFRRFLGSLVPDPHFQRLRLLTDTMDTKSRSIFIGKKEALLQGDEAVQRQISRGKDIMSILCLFS